ncbi:MAG: protein kinase [Acidobacteriota bacterium]
MSDRVREIFDEARDLEGPWRDAYLDDACGDDTALRREVESLLGHHDRLEAERVDVGDRRTRAAPSRRRPSSMATKVKTVPLGNPGRGNLAVGRVFAGRYRLDAELGRGGMGEVFRAHDLVLDQAVALKVLPESGSKHFDRLVNEVRLARQITHPNVCRVFDFGQAEGETFFTMELVDGDDLASLLRRAGPLAPDRVAVLAQQLCSGLAAAHDLGILHRDLKPANVLIDGQGRARLADFGIAVRASVDTNATSDSEASTVVPTPATAGTPSYIAPELWNGEPPTVASDLYAVGLVLYEAATGEPAIRGGKLADVARQHLEDSVEISRLAGLDPSLEEGIERCLEKDPSMRPRSVRALAATLPGADPLERALAAGQTPSPDTIARSMSVGGLGPPQVASWLVILLALLAGVLVGSDASHPGRQPWAEPAPEVRASWAEEVLETLGYDALPVADRAWGIYPDPDSLDPDGLLFWYRQSPWWLVPDTLDGAVVSEVGYYDPPPLDEGSVQMLLDAEGRLVTLKVLPAGFDGRSEGLIEGELDDDTAESGEVASPPAEPEPVESEPVESEPVESEPVESEPVEPDWAPLFEVARLADAPRREVEPESVPPLFADLRRAWLVDDATSQLTYRLEVATLGGRVVFVDRRPEGELPELPLAFVFELSFLLSGALSVLLVGAAIVGAWLNLRAGRGDPRGTRWLAAFVAVVQAVRWLVGSDHVPFFDVEVQRAAFVAGRILFEGLLAAIVYLALEPTARRHWPRALVAWSRLTRGHWRDQQVGVSVLVGAAVGAGWALVGTLDRLLVRALGLTAAPDDLVLWQLDQAMHGRRLLAGLLGHAVDAVYYGVLALFFLAVLRSTFKRMVPTLAVFVVVHAAILTSYGAHPAVSWILLGVGVGASGAWILVRFGLLAYIAASFVHELVDSAPLTLDSNSFYLETGVGIALVVAFLGIGGAWFALGSSRPSRTLTGLSESSPS